MASLRTVAPTASGLRVNLRSAKSVLPVRRSVRALAVRAEASKQEEVGFQASNGRAKHHVDRPKHRVARVQNLSICNGGI